MITVHISVHILNHKISLSLKRYEQIKFIFKKISDKFFIMKFIIFLTTLISLTACGSGSNVTINSSVIDQNVDVSKFEESKFGSSKFN